MRQPKRSQGNRCPHPRENKTRRNFPAREGVVCWKLFLTAAGHHAGDPQANQGQARRFRNGSSGECNVINPEAVIRTCIVKILPSQPEVSARRPVQTRNRCRDTCYLPSYVPV